MRSGDPLYVGDEIAAARRAPGAPRSPRITRGNRCVLLGVLKGALCFTGDLARALAGRGRRSQRDYVDYLCVERYGAAGAIGGRRAALAMDCEPARWTGRNVVIVEDIADKGLTLAVPASADRAAAAGELSHVRALRQASARRRRASDRLPGPPACPNRFVIGYGLDYQEITAIFRTSPSFEESQTV